MDAQGDDSRHRGFIGTRATVVRRQPAAIRLWHKFTATAHSPIGLNPAAEGLTILGPAFAGFAENDLRHADSRATCPPWLQRDGLRTAVLNYIGAGLDLPVQRWFTHRVKPSRVARTWLKQALAEISPIPLTAERRCVWTGALPSSCHTQRG